MSARTDKGIGRLKQAAADLTDNDDLRREGKKDEAAGKVKDAAKKAADKVGDLVDAVRKKDETDD